jgi:beta-glucosidase
MSTDIEKILQSLTLEEKISLLAGKDFWETVPVQDKGVPAIKVRLLPTHSNITIKSI